MYGVLSLRSLGLSAHAHPQVSPSLYNLHTPFRKHSGFFSSVIAWRIRFTRPRDFAQQSELNNSRLYVYFVLLNFHPRGFLRAQIATASLGALTIDKLEDLSYHQEAFPWSLIYIKPCSFPCEFSSSSNPRNQDC